MTTVATRPGEPRRGAPSPAPRPTAPMVEVYVRQIGVDQDAIFAAWEREVFPTFS